MRRLFGNGRPPCPGDSDGAHFYRFKQDNCEHCGLAFDDMTPARLPEQLVLPFAGHDGLFGGVA